MLPTPFYSLKCNFSKLQSAFPWAEKKGKPVSPHSLNHLEIDVNHIKALTHTVLILGCGEISVFLSDTPAKSRLWLPNLGNRRGAEQSMSVMILTAVGSSAPHFNSVSPEHKLSQDKKQKNRQNPHLIHKVHQKC